MGDQLFSRFQKGRNRMIKSLVKGGMGLIAMAASAGAAQAYDVPDNLFIDEGRCSAGVAMYTGDGSRQSLEEYLSGARESRETAYANSGFGDVISKAFSRKLKRRADTQVVYLEFNPGAPDFPVLLVSQGQLVGILTFPDYIYTQEDKDLIQARLEADYALYDYEFTQFLPTDGDFTTLTFGDNDAGNITLDVNTGGLGILFGAAENIDFRNDNFNDNAFIDASLWKFLAELDRANGTNNLGNLSGIPVNDPSEIDAVEQLAVQNQSSNTGSHELGHIQGLRHHDSIGAPGDGLPPALDPASYLPVGETDTNAVESLLHTMASGASVGLPLTGSTLQDRFFGERSAVKLALNGFIDRRVITEQRARERLKLRFLKTPNPLEEGVNDGAFLFTRASLIEGRLDEVEEVDRYKFFGLEGQTFNSEVISFSDSGFAEPIIGLLVLKYIERGGNEIEVARNRLTFEGIEPMIIDFELPFNGRYVLEVSSPATIDFQDGNPPVPLALFGLGGFEVGDYDLHTYIVEAF